MYRVTTILFLCVLVLGAGPADAQSGREYGATFGFNRATLESSVDLGTHSAAAAGIIVRQSLSGPVALQTELLLNQKGTEVDREGGGGIAYSAAYAEVPVLLHVAAPRFRTVRIYGEVGGYGGVKMFERQTPASGQLNISLRTGTSFYHRVNAGALAGIGATFSLRERQISFIVRYSHGLVDVARDVDEQPFPEAEFPEDGKTRTWTLQFRFGF